MKVTVNCSFNLCDFDQNCVAFSSHVESTVSKNCLKTMSKEE